MRRRCMPFVVCLLSLVAATANAQGLHPAQLAPETSVFYAELSNPAPLIDLAFAPATRKLVEQSDGYRKYRQSEKYDQVQGLIGLLETRLGKKWEAALGELIGGGLAISFDPASNSGFLAIRSRDRELLTSFTNVLKEVVEAEAGKNGHPSPVKAQDYQGFTGWTFGGGEMHVIVEDLLLVSNNAETLKSVIDRYRDRTSKTLLGNRGFAAARAKQPAEAIGWSWVDLAAVRHDPNVQKGLSKRSDNAVIELLIGGVIDALKQAPYLTSCLTYDAGRLRLKAELPREASATSASRTWFFAPHESETALVPQGTIGTFTAFRDLAGLWLARDELFDEATVAKFAQADTQLGLFFSGRDFGPEVLGEMAAPVQVVVARQEYAAGTPTPALKLPAFALVFKLKHADDFAPELLMAYQKIIGIVNITGGQEGRPQFLLSTEEFQGATISKASYLLNSKAAKENAPPHFNFSPACARIGDHFILGSTVGIVRQLVDGLQPGRSTVSLADNAAFTVEAAPLAAILADNKELLITQNMLKEGHSRSEAEAAVQIILGALGAVDRLRICLVEEPGALAVEAVLQTRIAESP